MDTREGSPQNGPGPDSGPMGRDGGESNAPQEQSQEPRRGFLGALLAVGAAITGMTLAVPLKRFLLYPLQSARSGVPWTDLGPVASFASASLPLLKTLEISRIDGWRQVLSRATVYVTRDRAGGLAVLTSVCPHLGCAVGWRPDEQRFVCPCHGGIFTSSGEYVSGPPLRKMDALPSRIVDGRLQVRYEYFRSLVKTREVVG